MPRTAVLRSAAAFGLVALVLAVTACGGSTNTTAATTTTTLASGNGANRLAAFRACMQGKGITLPANFRTGRGGGGAPGNGGTADTSATAPTTTIPAGVSPQQWQAAIKACASTLPPRPNLQNNPQVQIYYNCLNSYLSTHGGTTLPPLGQGGAGGLFGGRGANGTGNTTTTNPTLQAAQAHCAALRPTFGGQGTTPTSIG